MSLKVDAMVRRIEAGCEPLPGGPFDIIYADPPWDYGAVAPFTKSAAKPWYSVKDLSQHYPTMTADEIMQLDVQSIAAADCLLFLWVTAPKIDEAVDIGRAWGFEWATMGFVWEKQRPRPGYYTLGQCEFVGIFKRGRIPKPRGARNVRQFLSEKYGKHSVKPAEIRRRITEMFPTQRKLEMFARNVDGVDGWEFWGNEV